MKTGLLFRQIIFAVPIYKYDSQLSCLVSIPMPLNVINVLLIPIFLVVKDPKKKKSILSSKKVKQISFIKIISSYINININIKIYIFV